MIVSYAVSQAKRFATKDKGLFVAMATINQLITTNDDSLVPCKVQTCERDINLHSVQCFSVHIKTIYDYFYNIHQKEF